MAKPNERTAAAMKGKLLKQYTVLVIVSVVQATSCFVFMEPPIVYSATITVIPSDNYAKIESAQAGDVVDIAPGTYRFRVYLHSHGTAENPIIIRAQDPNNRPVWDLDGKDCDDWPGSYSGGDSGRGAWQIAGAYYEISGIIIKNSYLKTGSSISNSCGMRQKGSENITIRNCLFENNDNGISGYGENILYEYCVMRYNGNPDGDMTHNIYSHGGTQTFRYCHIYDPDEGQNLHIRAKTANFEYCLIRNAKSYTGDLMVSTNDYVDGQPLQETITLLGCVIVEADDQSNDTKAFTLYNSPSRSNVSMRINMYYNTFIGNGKNGVLVQFTDSGLASQKAYLYNNIFYGNHRPFRFDTTSGVTAVTRNNWWPAGYDYSDYLAYISDSIFGIDPGFADFGNGDYTLGASAQAINQANATLGETPTSEYYLDANGDMKHTERTGANDLGAFESTAAEPDGAPHLPQNLRVISQMSGHRVPKISFN